MPKRKNYTIKFKIGAIDWYNANGKSIHSTFKHFDVDRKRIREWLKNEAVLRSIGKGKKLDIKRLHPGMFIKVFLCSINMYHNGRVSYSHAFILHSYDLRIYAECVRSVRSYVVPYLVFINYYWCCTLPYKGPFIWYVRKSLAIFYPPPLPLYVMRTL